MSGHTPGPWRVRDRVGYLTASGTVVDGPDDVMVALCDTTEDSREIEAPLLKRCQANARLIAAAPQMLAELRIARDLVEKWCNYQGDDPSLFTKYVAPIDAAIAAAEGAE